MHLSNIVSATAIVLHFLGKVQAKAVFAHYMVFPTTSPQYVTKLTSIEKVGTATQDHAQQDIDDAIAIGWVSPSPGLHNRSSDSPPLESMDLP